MDALRVTVDIPGSSVNLGKGVLELASPCLRQPWWEDGRQDYAHLKGTPLSYN